MLISSSRNKNRWVVPGGGIEDNENPEDAAEREVFEEAGVIGRLDRFLGVFEVIGNLGSRKINRKFFHLESRKKTQDHSLPAHS